MTFDWADSNRPAVKAFHTQQIGVIFIPFNKDFSLQSTTQEEGISFSAIC